MTFLYRLRTQLLPVLLFTGVLVFFTLPFEENFLTKYTSLKVYARDGSRLIIFREKKRGTFSDWTSLHDFPPLLKKALITSEDKRFYFHPGFDPLSIARSAYFNITQRRIVSGGSTITQQLARILYHGRLSQNKYLRKIEEIFLAVKIELHYSKDEILESYLNNVPLKFNTLGFTSASERIFERNISLLSNEEIIALIVLTRENYTSQEIFTLRFNLLWKRMNFQKEPDRSSLFKNIYRKTPVSTDYPQGSEHFSQWIRSHSKNTTGRLNTEIDAGLNDTVHNIINSELSFLKEYNVNNSAVVVLELPGKSGQFNRMIVMVGSENFRGTLSGQVNGAITIRTAGSTLKPYIYGLAFDKLHYRPWTVLHDRETSLPAGDGSWYIPENYDQEEWGDITLREALIASRNIPAVVTVEKLGIEVFYEDLRRGGFTHLKEGPAFYGPGLALGTGGASLFQLTHLYSSFATGGILYPVTIGTDSHGKKIDIGKRTKLLEKNTSAQITHILTQREISWKNRSKRSFLDFPYEVAVKTGTSKDFRDAWVIGYTNRYVIGVWVGNFSGAIMKRVSGAWGAGRIFQQVVRLLHDGTKPSFSYPDDLTEVTLCRDTGMLPQDNCPVYTELVSSEDLPEIMNSSHRPSSEKRNGTIDSPAEGESFIIDSTVPLDQQKIPVRVSGIGRFILIYGGKRRSIEEGDELLITPERGRHTLKLLRDNEILHEISYTVE